MICYVCPESFGEEQDCIEIEALTPEEALRKAQEISNQRGELVDLFLPPDLDVAGAIQRVGPEIDADLVS